MLRQQRIGVSFINTAVPSGGTGSAGICTSSGTSANGRFFDLVYTQISSTSQTFTFTLNADLVKLAGPWTTGAASFSGTIAHMDWVVLGRTANRAFSGPASADISLSASPTIRAQTCTVTQPGSVNLGAMPTRTFTGVGSASLWGHDFTINVDCPDVASKVFMVLSDVQNNGNTSSTLPLTASSTARGVGLQIKRQNGNAAISFGPDSAVAGTIHQFPVFTSDGNTIGPVPLVFSTRYIQTTATVRPGSANGRASFTMSYQ